MFCASAYIKKKSCKNVCKRKVLCKIIYKQIVLCNCMHSTCTNKVRDASSCTNITNNVGPSSTRNNVKMGKLTHQLCIPLRLVFHSKKDRTMFNSIVRYKRHILARLPVKYNNTVVSTEWMWHLCMYVITSSIQWETLSHLSQF